MPKLFTADFETITKEDDCRVWAYAICEIGNTDNFMYGNNLDDFMEWCATKEENYKVYFHNLKFDGEYILSWLFHNGFEWIKDKKERRDHTFTTLITDAGQFYSLEIWFRVKGKRVNKVTIYDSLKILNFSVEKIANDFNLPIQKLSIDYQKDREPGYILNQEEIDYIRNDVEIMARALEIMFKENLKKMTIASDAFNNFKDMCPKFKYYFPVMDYNRDKDIRKSYKGGFTYLSPLYREKQTGAGVVFDKNSMYPAKMKFERLPYGQPLFFEGKYENDGLYDLYVQRFSCAFKLKPGKIPSIQIKSNMMFKPNEYIEDTDGQIVTLTLTNPDFELFLENYDHDEIYYDGGWKFTSMRGIFSEYIDYWTEQKIKSKKEGNSAKTAIAKLMLNSLYGRFGMNPDSRVKHPYMEDGVVKYHLGDLEKRDPIYTPVASFITAYARADIIRSSEAIREFTLKKYGYDGYIYSDTDSIHCLISENDIEELSKVMDIDDYRLGAWKLESKFKRGKYLRQKCYIEEDYNDELNITVAGLPKKLKNIVNFQNFEVGFSTSDIDNLPVDEYGREISKLTYKHVKGGVLLVPTDFTIK